MLAPPLRHLKSLRAGEKSNNNITITILLIYFIGRNYWRKVRVTALAVTAISLLVSCGGGGFRDITLSNEVVLNPSGYAPLSALITLRTTKEVSARLRVVGQDGPDSDIVVDFPVADTLLSVPVHGLYAGVDNIVELSLYSPEGDSIGTQKYKIQTQPLISALPKITIEKANRAAMSRGMTFVSYYGHDGIPFPQRPFIFDSYGKIRWYLDYQKHPELNNLFYEDGMERLANGNLIFGSGGEEFGIKANNRIYEIDLFGNVLNTWEMPGYGFHHEVFEKPDGNLLVTANKLGADTVEDYVIEIDRNTREIVNEWDLNKSLDNRRNTWVNDRRDWFHGNAVLYDDMDGSIIVSGRTQGIVKLTDDNKVVWILAPYKDWKTSGSGSDLTNFLLQPLNSNGEPILDKDILQGNTRHPDFEWPWYQHAPALLPNGDLLVFDNGQDREYTGLEDYSRAVRYRIDEEDLEIQQLWQYGKERGKEVFSRIVGDVDYLEGEDHILVTMGNVQHGGSNYGKSIEVDYKTKEVLFEATIVPPVALFDLVTLNRTERMTLYPE